VVATLLLLAGAETDTWDDAGIAKPSVRKIADNFMGTDLFCHLIETKWKAQIVQVFRDSSDGEIDSQGKDDQIEDSKVLIPSESARKAFCRPAAKPRIGQAGAQLN
jgi:hypothetical protein